MWNGFGANTLPPEEAPRDELWFQRPARARPIPAPHADHLVWNMPPLTSHTRKCSLDDLQLSCDQT